MVPVYYSPRAAAFYCGCHCIQIQKGVFYYPAFCMLYHILPGLISIRFTRIHLQMHKWIGPFPILPDSMWGIFRVGKLKRRKDLIFDGFFFSLRSSFGTGNHGNRINSPGKLPFPKKPFHQGAVTPPSLDVPGFVDTRFALCGAGAIYICLTTCFAAPV